VLQSVTAPKDRRFAGYTFDMDEIATLRLQTLRMLLKRRSRPLVIVEDTADDAEIEQLAREHHAPIIVVVDRLHALLGTVSPHPVKVISLLAEEEVGDTARRVAEDEVDYVLVAEGNGHLIGVLSADDITARAA